MTLLEVIQRSTEFLTRKGVDSPRLQAELLLAQLLKMPRMKLYLNFERTLSPEEENGFRELVQRRGRREPLQHILGTASFCGLEIRVSPDVLVPRPETELLAEQAWIFLNQLALAGATGLGALDFGTGSGCLAIALADKCPGSTVWALDISEPALAVARDNAARNRVADRTRFIAGDGFAALPPGQPPFHLLVSNPPYIPTGDIDMLDEEVRDFDPRAALDGGPDGLDFFRRLAADAARFLRPEGKLMVEFGDGQADPLRALFESQNWVVEAIREDYTQRPRILVAHHGKLAH